MPFYNSLCMLGGFLGPYLTGVLLQRRNGIITLSLVFGAIVIAAGFAIILLRHFILRGKRMRDAQDGAATDFLPRVEGSVGKDVEAPPGVLRKESGADLGVEMGPSRLGGAAALQHRPDAKRMLPAQV